MAAFCVNAQVECKDTTYKFEIKSSYYQYVYDTLISNYTCGYDTSYKTKYFKFGTYLYSRRKPATITPIYCKDTTITKDSFLVETTTAISIDSTICREVPKVAKYGLWGNGDNVSERKLQQYNGSITGFNIRMDAATFNPAKGVWNTSYITSQLDVCRRYGLKVILMMFTGDNMPSYMFQQGASRTALDGVFAPVKTDRGTYPYYADPDYDVYLKMIWDKWYEVTKNYSDIIIAYNPTMGSTGDVGNDGGYKGDPLDIQYNILPQWWDSYTRNSWQYFDTHYNVKTLINVGNDLGYLDWGVQNLRNMIAIKQGNFTHGIDNNGELTQMQGIAKYPNLIVRGEMEGGVFPAQLVTAIVFQCAYVGVDVINVAPDKLTAKGLTYANTYLATENKFWYPHSGSSIAAYYRGIEVTGGGYGLNDNVQATETFGMHYWAGNGTLKTAAPKLTVTYLDDAGSITIGNKTITGTGSKKQLTAQFDNATTINSSMHIYLIEGK